MNPLLHVCCINSISLSLPLCLSLSLHLSICMCVCLCCVLCVSAPAFSVLSLSLSLCPCVWVSIPPFLFRCSLGRPSLHLPALTLVSPTDTLSGVRDENLSHFHSFFIEKVQGQEMVTEFMCALLREISWTKSFAHLSHGMTCQSAHTVLVPNEHAPPHKLRV